MVKLSQDFNFSRLDSGLIGRIIGWYFFGEWGGHLKEAGGLWQLSFLFIQQRRGISWWEKVLQDFKADFGLQGS